MMQGQRLKNLIEKRGLSVTEFSEKIGRDRTYLQKLFNEHELPFKFIKIAAPLLGVDVNYFLADRVGEADFKYGTPKANITHVPFHAQAGARIGFGDTVIKDGDEFEKFKIPGLTSGNYIAFTINGDSMPPLRNGDIIICKGIEKMEYVKENVPYAFLLKDEEGLVVKTATFNSDKKTVTFHSYAKHYPPFVCDIKKIKSVWYIVDAIIKDPVSRLFNNQ